MVHFITTLSLILLSTFSFGQIDMENIKRNTSDSSGEYYYPKLVARFKNSDSTLSKNHFTHIYYGSTFLDSYNVERITETEQSISDANYNQQYLRAYELADSLLQHYPASILAYFEKAYACYNLKRFDEETYNRKRYKVLLQTVLNSGDGKSISSAWYANLPNDEFEVLKYLGLEVKEEADLEAHRQVYDYLVLKPNKLKRKEAFFNITSQSK